MYKSIVVSPSTSTASFLSACTSARSARALVGIHTSAALSHPGRNFAPLFSAGFLRFSGLEISTLIRPFNRGSHPFSSFGNLIPAQADVSFQLVSALPIHRLLGNYMWKCAHILPAPCKSSSSSRLSMKQRWSASAIYGDAGMPVLHAADSSYFRDKEPSCNYAD